MFQMTFAAITVALISGAYIERIRFSVWVIFSILWFSLVYLPIAHWVWGGGFLSKLGVIDFAGGIVVHTTAGVAALVGALMLKERNDKTFIPHNLTLVILGTGLLWFGWFGLASGTIAGLATIPPAAGFVNLYGALIIGIIAGLLCFISVAFFKPRLGYDDTLDAFGIHGVGGITGTLCAGLLADPSVNKIAGLF